MVRPAQLSKQRTTGIRMADRIVPHFHNSAGVPTISIGAREFMCIGALPPFDHPHIFIDMGDENEAVCSYCSTVYRFDPKLDARETIPPGALYDAAA
jgi:uncharacterized Zn-finger protein